MAVRKRKFTKTETVTTQSRENRLSQVFLREIKRNYGDAIFLTRDDLLQLPVFGHVGTSTRVLYINKMVNHLIDARELVSKSKTALCLKSKSNAYEATPLRDQYSDTIRAIVSNIGRKPFTVMDVVNNWTTDPHITPNNKRVAVRQSMRRLVADGVIKSYDEFRYTLKDDNRIVRAKGKV